ncbi:unnamed protein product [Chrysodeixis includens]|uniref:Uncharacterized protein n=1 Tax=Chrysodeixis includens TaxID=689277 RepID=A0A9N8KXP9_CHRIL|nr:unnamed protein product [Chrysodeixis includens]
MTCSVASGSKCAACVAVPLTACPAAELAAVATLAAKCPRSLSCQSACRCSLSQECSSQSSRSSNDKVQETSKMSTIPRVCEGVGAGREVGGVGQVEAARLSRGRGLRTDGSPSMPSVLCRAAYSLNLRLPQRTAITGGSEWCKRKESTRGAGCP